MVHYSQRYAFKVQPLHSIGEKNNISWVAEVVLNWNNKIVFQGSKNGALQSEVWN